MLVADGCPGTCLHNRGKRACFPACLSVATDFFLNSQQSDLNRFLNNENPNGRHVYVL